MPRLPVPQFQTTRLIEPIAVRPMQAPGADGIANALVGIGAGIQQHVDRERAAEDSLAITNAMSRLRVAAAEGAADDGDAEGMATRITGRFEKQLEAEYERMSPRARQAFSEGQGVHLLTEVRVRAVNAERGAKLVKLRAGVEDGVQADGQAVFTNPADAVDVMARRLASIEVLPLPAAEREDAKRRARESIASVAVATRIQREPGAVLKQLSNISDDTIQKDPVLSSLPADKLQRALHQAQVEVQRRSTEDRYRIESQTKDVQAMVLNGVSPPQGSVPTKEQYVALHGRDGAVIWQQEVGNFLELDGGLQQMRSASAAERQALVERATPEPGTGFAGNLQKRNLLLQAKQITEKRIVDDPAAYALENSPLVSAPGTTFGSPTSRQAAIDMAMQRYALTMTAEQLRLGIDTIRDDRAGNKARGPKLLTNTQANAYVDQFNDMQTGGAKSAELVAGLEKFYGKYWPQVYIQLASDDRMPPAALVIPNMRNDSSRALLAQVSAMKPAELEALVKAGDMPVIKEETLKAFSAAQPSFVAQGPNGNRTMSILVDQAQKLATVYASRGRKPTQAAEQAFADVVGWKYNWVSIRSPMSIAGREEHYRVPVEFNSGQVSRGADATVEDLVKTRGAKVFTGEAVPQVLTDDALRFRSMWITNSDETGLELRLRGADGGFYAVEGTDGKPIGRSWAELISRATAARAVDITGEGTQDWMRRRQQELNPRRDNVLDSQEQRDRMYGIGR
jgi:hypothetical protein